jgi:flavin-dependent dehydrogenase
LSHPADEPEVLVVGGGPAGAAAAITLASAGRRVLLVDAEGAGSAAAGGLAVGEALPPAARPLLRDLGVLAAVEAGGHLPCVGNVSVWGAPTPVTRDFLRHPHGPGWHLDRARFDASLRRAAAEAGAEVRCGARVVAVEREGDGGDGEHPESRRAPERERQLAAAWRARLRGDGAERSIRCRWLIDASGRAGVVARRVGAIRRRDERLLAFVARFRPTAGAEEDRDDRTWIEAVAGGWWYSARVPGGDRIVALHTDPDLADRAALRTAAGLAAELAQAPALAALLAAHGYHPTGRPRGVDAGGARLDPAAGPGWLVVGDAAVSFDPLSSQGLLNALYTGLRGAQAVDRALAGDAAAPADYAARVAEIHRAYRSHHAAYYAAERRWVAEPFWRRRAAPVASRHAPTREPSSYLGGLPVTTGFES